MSLLPPAELIALYGQRPGLYLDFSAAHLSFALEGLESFAPAVRRGLSVAIEMRIRYRMLRVPVDEELDRFLADLRANGVNTEPPSLPLRFCRTACRRNTLTVVVPYRQWWRFWSRIGESDAEEHRASARPLGWICLRCLGSTGILLADGEKAGEDQLAPMYHRLE